MEGELTTTKPEGNTDVWIHFKIKFHAHSDHINGTQYDVNMNIVHINKATRALKGSPSLFFETLTVEFATNLDKITKVN